MRRPTRGIWLVTLMALTLGARAQEPSPYEMELWRAATRLDAPDGYRDYLARFPNGGFAALARLALQKHAGAQPVPGAAAAAPSGAALDPGLLRELKDRTDETGATHVRPGERYIGPGVVTVGWFGSKKQIIVPPGEWIVLAAFDHTLRSATAATYTTLAFGQVAGNALAALWVTTSTSRTFGAHNMPASSLVTPPLPPAADTCETKPAGDLAHEVVRSSGTTLCARVRQLSPAESAGRLPEGLDARLSRSLNLLRVAPAPFTMSAELHVVDRASTYAGYALYTTATAEVPRALGIGGSKARPADPAAVTSWWMDLRPYARDGHAARFRAADLTPGEAPRDVLSLAQ